MYTSKYPTLKSMFPNYMVDGAIFSKMPEAPWVSVDGGLSMDIAYLSSFSGIKPPSSLCKDLLDENVLDQQKLADTLWKLFGHNWQRLWDAYMAEYDPTNNYSITEKISRNETIDRGIKKESTVNYIGKGSTTTENDLTSETTDENTSTTTYGQKIETEEEDTAFTHGFNESNPVPTGSSKGSTSETHSGQDSTVLKDESTTKNTGTVTSKSEDSYGTATEDKTSDNTVDGETTNRTRSGNIGQNTYQELMRQEFELWKWNFFMQVFADCDKLLVLPYFGSFCSYIESRFNTVN